MGLKCYKNVWPGERFIELSVGRIPRTPDIKTCSFLHTVPMYREKAFEEITEVDRSDSCFFREYQPGMSFEAAEELERREVQNKKKSEDKISQNKISFRFCTPSNATWSDVEMYLIDKDHFKIIVKDLQKPVSYSQMGFKKDKSTKKTKLWNVLIGFAMANNSAVKYYDEKEKVEKDIQRLNDVLINYFGISGNPIKYQSDEKGYEAEFKIYDKSHLKEHMDSTTMPISDEEILDEEIDKDINDSCN